MSCGVSTLTFIFFFSSRRRHTRCSRDWSSDVCSSDLVFFRARDAGALDGIPGLVYARGERDGVAEELIDTGIQRLVGDLDELPDPVLGYRLLEPPSRWRATLAPQAVPASRVRRLSPISSLVL